MGTGAIKLKNDPESIFIFIFILAQYISGLLKSKYDLCPYNESQCFFFFKYLFFVSNTDEI